MSSEPTAAASPLHIEVVTDTYAPDINGVALSLARLCEGLRARGHRVEVIRSGKGGAGEVGLPWWPLPGYWEIKVGAPLPGQLRRRWEKQRPDVIYVAIETPLGFSASSAALKLGIPVVGGFHTNFREYLSKYGMEWFGEKVWAYQKWFHGRLALTLVPSPDAREKLLLAGFPKVGVLGRGVDTDRFHPSRRDESLRAAWGVAPDSPVAIVVGDGPARAKLQREHPEVRFIGYRTGTELAACYASADLMLFPSETETFGNVLLEGMASGLASLSYDYAASSWHCVNEVNALKVPKSDEDAFLEAAEVLLDPALRQRLGQAARVTAESLGWSSVVADMERVFREVIARRV